ncbi:MAG: hypothetical protein ACRD4L_07995 [Pyrinomonadaceae bacterium]
MITKLLYTALFSTSLLFAGCSSEQSAETSQLTTPTVETSATPTPAQDIQSPSPANQRTLPDGSVITTTEEADGTKVETRVFKDGSIEKMVVRTPRTGKRTAKVITRDGRDRDVPEGKIEGAFEATGEVVGKAVGVTYEKSKDVVSATKEGTEKAVDKTGEVAGDVKDKSVETGKTVGEKTVEGTKTVGEKTGDVAKTVGEKTVEGTKTVGKKTAEGAKKVGSKIKDAVTP